jgi:putative protein kinase ArgK-like GTPase of G3E family
LEEDALQALKQRFEARFPNRPILCISALGDIGLVELTRALMQALQTHQRRLIEDEAFAQYTEELQQRISDDVLAHSQKMRAARRRDDVEDSFDDDDDDGDVEVIYVNE